MYHLFEISKSIAKNTLLGNQLFFNLYHNRRHKSSDHHRAKAANLQYPIDVFLKHFASASTLLPGGVIGKDVLEIGPGGSVGPALLFMLSGARTAACVDAVPWARLVQANADELYGGIIRLVARDHAEVIAPTYAEQAQADPVGLSRELLARISYWAPRDVANTGLSAESVDLVYSQAVLEHVLLPDVALGEFARLLRSGGVASHEIDLRDHRDFARPLEFLRYSDRVWRMASSNSANYVRNRWRRSDYEAACARHGLQVVSVTSTRHYPVDEQQRSSFHPRYRTLSLAELTQTVIYLVARKVPN